MKFATLAAVATGASARTFTVYNACPFTIWPAIFTDLNVGSAVPSHPNGWEAAAYTKVTFTVPDNWRAGRIWGRRNCDFSKPGAQSCLTGSCNGGLVCNDRSGAGVPPATLAEFTFDGTDDWYDVSLVDGYNLPVRITNNQGCPVADCAKDLGPNCPSQLKGPFDASGFPVGCNTPATCPPSGVQFYDYFKSNCPNSYAYAYDESSGNALFKCASSKRADYTITFCP
ncbi:thaumatin-like protein [Coprinellus micaceus]|uniref:Thaumatin-like protein n=1 Tax=Coprinellus micaceus TaxID=71717 RepID=A0A4Y7TEM1_COPMI|nr:thaumatin-like protein [Coprinellus micaceus]